MPILTRILASWLLFLFPHVPVAWQAGVFFGGNFTPAGGGATYTLQSSNNTCVTTTGSCSPAAFGITSGYVLLVCEVVSFGDETHLNTTPSDSPTGNSYAAAFAEFRDSGNRTSTRCWTATASATVTIGAGGLTVTCPTSTNPDGAGLACDVRTYSCTGCTKAADLSATGSFGSGTSLTAGTTSALSQSELVVGVFGDDYFGSNVGPTYTAGGSFANIDYNTVRTAGESTSIVVEDLTASSGTQQATATSNTSATGGGGVTFTLK